MSISLRLFCSCTQFFVCLFDCLLEKKELTKFEAFTEWSAGDEDVLVQSENTKLIIHNKTWKCNIILYKVFLKDLYENIPVVKQISF